MDLTAGIFGLISIAGAALLFRNRKPSPPAIRERVQRKRLPRDDANDWADIMEDWFARLTWHVRFQYALMTGLAALVVYLLIRHGV